MLGTFTRSSSPPPDSKVQYPDLVMHELEQMRTDLNNEREYRAAMQLESSRMQESKFSLSLSLSLSLSFPLSPLWFLLSFSLALNHNTCICTYCAESRIPNKSKYYTYVFQKRTNQRRRRHVGHENKIYHN